MYGELNL